MSRRSWRQLDLHIYGVLGLFYHLQAHKMDDADGTSHIESGCDCRESFTSTYEHCIHRKLLAHSWEEFDEVAASETGTLGVTAAAAL